jgi:hypothetical protein
MVRSQIVAAIQSVPQVNQVFMFRGLSKKVTGLKPGVNERLG